MGSIIETDPEKLVRDILADAETRLEEPLYAGDERRMLLEVTGYVLGHQDYRLQKAWDATDIDSCSGDLLTERGQRVGVERSEGRPGRCWVRFVKADDSVTVVDEGTTVIFDGVRFRTDYQVRSFGREGDEIYVTATSAEPHPSASETSTINSLWPAAWSVEGRLETQRPDISLVGIWSPSGQAWIQTALCDDREDDVAFRAKVKAALARPGAYEIYARELLPDASQISISTKSPGVLRVMASRAGQRGIPEPYPDTSMAMLETYLMSHPKRLQGDFLEVASPEISGVKVVGTVYAKIGQAGTAARAVDEAVMAFCRERSGLERDLDVGDLIRMLDGAEGVERVALDSVKITSSDGYEKEVQGRPGYEEFGGGTMLRMIPEDFAIAVQEVV